MKGFQSINWLQCCDVVACWLAVSHVALVRCIECPVSIAAFSSVAFIA